jgi:hypothetical protein
MIEIKHLKDLPEKLYVSSFTQNYIQAQKRPTEFQQQNKAIEQFYFDTIETVKKLYATLPDLTAKKAYEKVMYVDSFNMTDLHELVLPTFYWSLTCESDCRYMIYYRFQNCPFEAEINALFKSQRRIDERTFNRGDLRYRYRMMDIPFNEKYFTVL